MRQPKFNTATMSQSRAIDRRQPQESKHVQNLLIHIKKVSNGTLQVVKNPFQSQTLKLVFFLFNCTLKLRFVSFDSFNFCNCFQKE